MGERPTPVAPKPGKRGPPPRAPWCCSHSVQSQLARVRPVAFVMGPHAHGPRTHSQWVAGPGRTPQVRAVGWEELPAPNAPHPNKGRRPRAPSCRCNNAQSKLARSRAGGFETGPHAHSPRTHSRWVARPGRTPSRAWESAEPRTPHTKARGAPIPGALVPPPQRAKQACKSACAGVGDGSPRPHPCTHSQSVAGPWPHTARTGGRA